MKQVITKTTLSSVLAITAIIGSAPVQACNDSPYMGMVCMTAATYCPKDYLEANGQLLSISGYTALFSLIGTTFGGDGRTSFALPDLRGRTAVGWGQGAGLTPVLMGQNRGNEQTTLSSNNLPSHNHPAHAANATATSVATNNSWPANPATNDRPPVVYNGYANSGSQVTLNSGVIGSTGDSASFSNVPPQLGMRYCVAAQGLFPPRN